MWLWQHADQAELAELEDARSRGSGRKLGDAMGWGRLGWFKGSWAVGKVRAGTRELELELGSWGAGLASGLAAAQAARLPSLSTRQHDSNQPTPLT